MWHKPRGSQGKSFSEMIYRVAQKKRPEHSQVYAAVLLTDFLKFFTATFSGKFAIK